MFSVAGVQLRVSSDYSNIQEMENRLASIAFRYPWVNMVVFSELAPFGPALEHAQTEAWKLEEEFQRMASRYGVWLIPGSHFVVEESGTANMSIVINPQGEIVGRYRKQFPFLPYEQGVTAGNEFLVFDVPAVGRFGLSICYDMWFPETSRTLAAMGAEIILHHFALPGKHRLRVAKEHLDPGDPAPFDDLGQLRGVVGTLTKQSMATHAVVILPYPLSRGHLGGDTVRIGLLRNLPHGVETQYQENPGEHECPAQEKDPRLPLA